MVDHSLVSNGVCTNVWLSLRVADAFKAKAQECGKLCNEFKTPVFFTPRKKAAPTTRRSSMAAASKQPSRMVSDHMVNIFFQEWAPLFPVVHRPTVLKIYTDYVNDPASVKDKHSIAQLNLIFGIAALSAEVRLLYPTINWAPTTNNNVVE